MNRLDYWILNFIRDYLTSPELDKIMIFITKLGDSGIIWVIICALLLISKKTRYIGLVALVALLFSEILCNEILKNIFHRNRPFIGHDDIMILIPKLSSYSFPSGHTTSSFAAAFVFGKYFKKPYAILTYVLATLISFSRLYLYVHFPTDVIAGFLLGLLCSMLAITLFDQYKRRQEKRVV